MRYQAGIQIILLLTALVIALTVVKPKFDSIRQVQTSMASYRDALDNIGRYNQRLQALLNQANSLPEHDRSALFRYLPEEVDTVSVARDISNIASQNQLLLLDISTGEPRPVTASVVETDTAPVVDPIDPLAPGAVSEPTEEGAFVEGGEVDSGTLMAAAFKVEVVGTYEQMKAMLADLERNNYPLRVVKLDFSLVDEGNGSLTQYSLELETYSLTAS